MLASPTGMTCVWKMRQVALLITALRGMLLKSNCNNIRIAFWPPVCHPRFRFAVRPKLVSGNPEEMYESWLASSVTVVVTATGASA